MAKFLLYAAGLLNARSVRNKGHAICETILDRELDALLGFRNLMMSLSLISSLMDTVSFTSPVNKTIGGEVGLVYKWDVKVHQNE